MLTLNSYGCIPKITTDPAVLEKIEASVQVLKDHLDNGYHVYGQYPFWVKLMYDLAY